MASWECIQISTLNNQIPLQLSLFTCMSNLYLFCDLCLNLCLLAFCQIV